MPISTLTPFTAQQLVKDLAVHLDPVPTREAVLELATAMNAVALEERRSAPGRCVALQVRHHLPRHRAAASVRAAAAELRASGKTLVTFDADRCVRYVAANLAAAPLGLKPRVVQRMLKTRDGRRALGWPYHVGGGLFMVPLAAVEDGRASFLNSLPDVEPPHPVPLPEGYK